MTISLSRVSRLTGLRDCNNEPGPGIERELVTGNSSASEGFPASSQLIPPGATGDSDIWPVSPHVSCHILHCSPLSAPVPPPLFPVFSRPWPRYDGISGQAPLSDVSASRGAAGPPHLRADGDGGRGEDCPGLSGDDGREWSESNDPWRQWDHIRG